MLSQITGVFFCSLLYIFEIIIQYRIYLNTFVLLIITQHLFLITFKRRLGSCTFPGFWSSLLFSQNFSITWQLVFLNALVLFPSPSFIENISSHGLLSMSFLSLIHCQPFCYGVGPGSFQDLWLITFKNSQNLKSLYILMYILHLLTIGVDKILLISEVAVFELNLLSVNSCR